MHYNNELDENKENILKTLIRRNILPTDLYKKIKLIINDDKFKIFNLVINLSVRGLQRTNVIYRFKCPLVDCISENKNLYDGLTSTILSKWLTMHLSDAQ